MSLASAVSKPVDQAKLDTFIGHLLGDLGACMTGVLVMIGDRLGLYRALHERGPASSQELALRTDTAERYVREWLAAQAAAGYVAYDAATGKYALTPEQAAVFADETSPAFFAGAFQICASAWRDEPKVTAAFKSGRGVGWHEHDECLFCGTERFFRPGYNQHLVSSWLPALDGVVPKLEKGALVADVGCGHGASTIIMAEAFPKARFPGYDYHAPSIERARQAAERAGVADRVRFSQAAAKDYPAEGYDLVCFFDCLHDMGDPVGAARHVRGTLAPGGTWMVVEPQAGDRVEDNLNPVGRIYYAASTIICTPASLSQEVGLALGAQAGLTRLGAVIAEAGFSGVRKVAETPFNMVLEARP